MVAEAAGRPSATAEPDSKSDRPGSKRELAETWVMEVRLRRELSRTAEAHRETCGIATEPQDCARRIAIPTGLASEVLSIRVRGAVLHGQC